MQEPVERGVPTVTVERPRRVSTQSGIQEFMHGGRFQRLAQRIVRKARDARGRVDMWFAEFGPESRAANSVLKREVGPDLHAIARNAPGSEQLILQYRNIPSSALQEVIRDVIDNVEEFDAEKIPLIATLIEKSAGRRENHVDDMTYIMTNIYARVSDDPEMAKHILSRLRDKAIEADIYEDINEGLRNLIGELLGERRPGPVVESRRAHELVDHLISDSNRRINAHQDVIRSLINEGVNLSQADRDEIDRELDRVVADQRIAPQDRARVRDELLEKRRDNLRESLIGNLPRSTEEADKQSNHLTQMRVRLTDLVRRGNIDERTAFELKREANEYYKIMGETADEEERLIKQGRGFELLTRVLDKMEARDARPEQRSIREEGNLQYAAVRSGMIFTERQHQVLAALQSPEALAEWLSQYPEDEWWERFQEDARDVLESVFSGIDANPLEFFDVAFDRMYENHFYRILIRHVRDLGEKLSNYSGDNEHVLALLRKNAKIPQIVLVNNPNQIADQGNRFIGGKERRARRATVTMGVGEAIGDILSKNLINLKEDTEYLHNAEVITYLGLGFEKLALYCEKLNTSHLDRIFTENQDMHIAYSFYVEALEDELARENRIITSEFGRVDEITNLDEIQEKAWIKFMAHLRSKMLAQAEEKGEDEVARVERETSSLAWERKMKRRIRMASGIAKGATMEFWEQLLTSHLVVSWRKEVKESAERREFHTLRTLYTAPFHRGVEKMITELDVDLLLERFGVPGHYEDIRYAFQHRDLDNPPNPWEDPYHHSRAHFYKGEFERGFFDGASDELLDFHEKYVAMGDFFRARVLGILTRDGWRTAQYDAHYVWEEIRGERVLNINRTLDNLRLLGPHFLRRFINDQLKEKVDDSMLAYILSRSVQYGDTAITSVMRKHNIGDFRAFIERFKQLQTQKSALDEVLKHHRRPSGAQKKLLAEYAEYKGAIHESLYQVEIYDFIRRAYPSMFVKIDRRLFTPESEMTLQEELHGFLYQRLNRVPTYMIEKEAFPLMMSAVELVEREMWEQNRRTNPNYTLEWAHFTSPRMRTALVELHKRYMKYTPTIEVSGSDQTEKFNISFEEFESTLQGFFARLRGSQDQNEFLQARRVKGEKNLTGERRNFGIDKIRRARNKSNERTTLSRRFAHYLKLGIEDFERDLNGSHIDYSEFLITQAGGSVVARFTGETNDFVQKYVPGVKALVNEGIPHFVIGHATNKGEIEALAKEYLLKTLIEMKDPLARMDQDYGDEYYVRMCIFLEKLLAKARPYRVKLLGDAVAGWDRRMHGKSATHMGRFFENTLERPITELDTDDVVALMNYLISNGHIAWNETIQHGDESLTDSQKKLKQTLDSISSKPIIGRPLGAIANTLLGSRTVPKPTWKRAKWNGDQIRRETGITMPDRFIETFIPLAFVIALVVMLALAYSASQKNKESEGR